MRCKSLYGPAFRYHRRGRTGYTWLSRGVLAGAVAGVAQDNQSLSRPTKPVVLPEADRVPNANEQMKMRDEIVRRQNFDAANAERLHQVTEASCMFETLAIARKAEVDNTSAGPLSENAVHRAENIEKLAQIVRERMQLSVAAP